MDDLESRHGDIHVCRKLAQSLVKVVHLGEDAAYDQDDEDVCRRMRELVVSSKRHLERNTKGLDEHDGDGARRRADGEVDERVLATILGCDLVDHEDAEDDTEGAVEEEACSRILLVTVPMWAKAGADVPGCRARFKISSTDWTSLSGGACSTMMTEPIRHIAQPIFPRRPNCSSRKYEPRTAPIRTERAPRGVTRMAGANAYAAKLNISPRTTTCEVSAANV